MELAARNITKRFNGSIALADASVVLKAGQVHALVGENGAGKSTLLKILAGAERRDAGTMTLDGAPYDPRSKREAERSGVALVFQELTINPALSIAENIYIDRLRDFAGPFGLVNRRRLERAAQEVLDGLGIGISVKDDLHRLDLGQWKCIEICRALSNDPKAVFLDESTAYLGRKEAKALLAAMAGLKARGLIVAFVSHHLDEVTEAADGLTILKDGRSVGSFAMAEIAPPDIHARMVGRPMNASIYPERRSRAASDPAPAPAPMVEVRDLVIGEAAAPLSLALNRGEILGVAGLKGAGGERLISILAGDRRPEGGSITLDGAPYAPRTPADAWRAGIAYLPADRGSEGLIGDFSVLDNLVLSDPPRKGPFFDPGAAEERARRAVAKLRIKAADLRIPCGSLSGGNMQKVLLGKCLMPDPRVLLLNNPTRGVDVGAREEIYRLIRTLAEEGMAVLLVSEDLPELLGMSDRIVVMRAGAETARYEVDGTLGEEDVVQHMI